jgi:transcriptional regulator with XRE-family HTH domain
MTEEWRDNFKRALRVQLRQKGWTQRDLSIHSGISEITISKYRNGTATPSVSSLIKMANALGCKFGDLADFD